MVTTTRRSSETNYTYESKKGGVGVLERPKTRTESAPANDFSQEEFTRRKAERQANLDRLLNYDRYSDVDVAPTRRTRAAIETPTFADEDIRPTSTTMQFGDDQIRKDMAREFGVEQRTYHLNKGGKLAVALYALAVSVILALIVINTGVLAKLSNTATAKTAQLNETVAKYNELRGEIDSLTDSNHIINVAENEFGMVKK